IAFYRACDTKNYTTTWKRLETSLKEQGKPGIDMNKEMVPIAKLDAVVKENPVGGEIVNVHDWPSWRGNVRNSAQASGSPPLLDTKLWSRPIFMDELDGIPGKDSDEATQDWVVNK